MIYWIGYFLFKIASLIFFPRTVLGLDNIPSKGSFIVASNHVSNLDPFIVGISSGHRLNYIAKESLFQNRLLGFLLSSVGAFPMKRDITDFRALRETLRRLKKGQQVTIFPEGTRKGVAEHPVIHPGIGFLAVKTGLPVIPVFLDGPEKVLPPGAKFLRRHRVIVSFGKPLYFSKQQSYSQIADLVMEKISSLPLKRELI